VLGKVKAECKARTDRAQPGAADAKRRLAIRRKWLAAVRTNDTRTMDGIKTQVGDMVYKEGQREAFNALSKEEKARLYKILEEADKKGDDEMRKAVTAMFGPVCRVERPTLHTEPPPKNSIELTPAAPATAGAAAAVEPKTA
jgi:phosphoserine phosphatase